MAANAVVKGTVTVCTRQPIDFQYVEKKLLVDEVGRARDPKTGAILNIGRRERLPLATEDRYSRQVKLKEDFEAECLELRQQVQGLQSKLGDSQSRIAQLEAAEAPLLEEISYLRGLTGVIYEKHRIDAYHNLGLGMQNTRLKQEVHGLRNIGERTASGLAPITAGSAADGPTNSEASALEEENFSLTRQVAALQYELDQMSSTGTQDQPDAFSEFGDRVFQCVVGAPGVGYRLSPDFGHKAPIPHGVRSPQVLVADAICQGPKAAFIRCSTGRGWLPLTDESGQTTLFKHVGHLKEIDINDFELVSGARKFVD